MVKKILRQMSGDCAIAVFGEVLVAAKRVVRVFMHPYGAAEARKMRLTSLFPLELLSRNRGRLTGCIYL